MARGSVGGVKFKKVGDKFSDTRVDLILDLKKNDFFLEKTYNGKDIFYNGNGHIPQEKQYFLCFVGFSLPAKIVFLLVKKLVPNSAFWRFFF